MAGAPTDLKSHTFRGYLRSRGLVEGSLEFERFLGARLRDLTPPDLMAGRKDAARRIARALRGGERIVVFGDYDCDGMTATAILTEAFEKLGARAVVPLLASRFSGGYGLSGPALARVLEAKPGLVVTCDCGSSDHESLRALGAHGIDVVVIDHHLVPDEPLPALAFLNPHRPECGFPYKGLASCGLALSIVAAIRTELGLELDLRQWLDLVAIGTIADVAPLDGDNRALTKAGLAVLSEGKRPGLKALFDVMGMSPIGQLGAMDVSFRVAPRLNAPGRLGSPEVVLKLLLAKDTNEASVVAAEVERLCQLRREEQERMFQEARAEALQRLDDGALVLGREGWNHGIVGIIAGKLADEFELPTVAIGFERGVGRGSARGPAGFPLFDAIGECASHLVRFGGHQAAAGLELEWERLEEFRQAFRQACRKRSDFVRVARPSPLWLDERDRVADVFADLRLLEPWGEKNPRPPLSAKATVRACRTLKGAHLKLQLKLDSGDDLSAFGPNLSASAPELGSTVELRFDIREDRYRGGGALELLVHELTPTSP